MVLPVALVLVLVLDGIEPVVLDGSGAGATVSSPRRDDRSHAANASGANPARSVRREIGCQELICAA